MGHIKGLMNIGAVSLILSLVVANIVFMNAITWHKLAFAVPNYVISGESSCLGIALDGGSSMWDGGSNKCTFPTGTELTYGSNMSFEITYEIQLVNFGTVHGKDDGAAFLNRGSIHNYGEIVGGTIINEGQIENTGLISLPGLVNRRSIVNAEDGVLQVSGGLHNYDSSLINHGVLQASGVLHNYGHGEITNYGTFETTNDDGDDINEGFINNFGIITNTGNNTLTNFSFLNNHPGALIENSGGRLYTHEAINNLKDGTIVQRASSTFVNFDSALINNDGIINVDCNATLDNRGAIRRNPVSNACNLDPDLPPEISTPSSVSFVASRPQTDICNPVRIDDAISSGSDANVESNAIDNDLATRWLGDNPATRQLADGEGSWIAIQLSNTTLVCGLDIGWYQGDKSITDFSVSVSRDGTFFREVFSGKSSRTLQQEHYDFPDSVAKYVRITVNGNSANNRASVTEIDASGYTALGIVVAPDDVDGWGLVQNDAPSNAFPIGTTTVTWMAMDSMGGTACSNQQVTFSGSPGPAPSKPQVTFSCPADQARPSPPYLLIGVIFIIGGIIGGIIGFRMLRRKKS